MSGLRKIDLLVKRKGFGIYDNGIWIQYSPDTEFTIKASVQPLSGSDLRLLPENRREEEILKIYTSTELVGSNKGQPFNPDIVIINGKPYEVFNGFNWQNGIINHYKYFLSKRTTNDVELT